MEFKPIFVLFALPCVIFSASQEFLSQGPSPSFAAYQGPGNSDCGTVGPIAVSPIDPNTLFIGGVNGGIWRTKDFGVSWKPLTDHKNTLSIASLAFDPLDVQAKTLIAGSGISSNGGVGNFIQGGPQLGIFYSTDGGDTWSEPAGNGSLTASVVGVAARGNMFLAATFEPEDPSDFGSAFGLFRSVNGGNTFNKVSFPGESAASPVTSLADDSGPSNFWAAVSNPNTTNKTALFNSVDAGQTWAQIFGAAQSNGLIQNTTQTILKVAKGPGNTLAVAVINTDVGSEVDKITGVFWSGDNGGTWKQLFDLATATIDFNPEGQGVINSALSIDPKNGSLVYVTGSFFDDPANSDPVSAYRFDASLSAPLNVATPFIQGGTVPPFSFAHADSRFMAFSNGQFLLSTDGGFDLKQNPTITGEWKSLNSNLSLWQVSRAAFDANHQIILVAGQDTDVALQDKPNLPNFTSFPFNGDGENAFVNDITGDSVSYYYSTIQFQESFNRITNTGSSQSQSFITLTGGVPGGEFAAPIVLNPQDPQKMAVAGGTTDTDLNNYAISLFTDDLTSTSFALTPVGSGIPLETTIDTIAYGTRDAPNALLAGGDSFTSNGLFFSADVTVSDPMNVGSFGGESPVNVVFDPRASARYFVIDSFQDLYQTTNSGGTFTNITGLLPSNLQGTNSNLISNEFLSNNGVNALFFGGLSDDGTLSPLGVADSDGMGTLSNYRLFGTGGGTSLPNSMVNQITYNNKSDTLLASVYGRGLWLMYDVTSNFPSATQLWFGKANNDSTPDADILAGSRPMIKFGTGTMTITGATAYTGMFNVNAGTVVMLGSIQPSSITTVASGATLKGTGSLGTVNLNGTVSPGLSIGTLSVGDFTFNGGSIYDVELNNTQSDLLASSGTVTINAGATIVPVPLGLNRSALSAYTIITAATAVTVNSPFTVINGFPRYLFSAQYTPNSVLLLLKQLLVFSASGNAGAAATCYNTMLDDLPADLINLTDILDAQTTEQWQGSFNQMQPANFNDIAYGQENVAERIRQMFSDHLYEQKALQCCHPYQWQFWMAPFYETVHQSGSGSKRGYEEQFGGVTVAGDYQLPENWVFTTGFSFASSDLDITHGRASSSFNSYAGSLGALWRGSAFYADALFSYQYCTIEAHRRMQFSVETPLFTAEDIRKASHTQGSNQIMGHVGGGFDAIIQKRTRHVILCYPFISLDYLYVMQKSYTEHGAQSIDLHVKSKQTDLLRPEAGFGVRYRKCSDNFTCLLDTALSYVHEFRFLGKHTTSSFTASSCEFRTAGLFPQNNLVCPSVRLRMASHKTGISATLAYHGEYGVAFLENTGEGELRFAF